MEKIDIVISRYNENLKWTTVEPFNSFKYIVYNKGNNENFEKTNVKTIINLPNVGRECHTFLYHIIKNYDEKNFCDITLFVPGSILLPNETDCPYKYKKLIATLNYLINNNFTHAVSFAESTDDISKRFYDFQIVKWRGTNKDNSMLNNNDNLISCEYRPFYTWYDHYFKNTDVKWWSYNSIFSIDKKDILAVTKDIYVTLCENLSKGFDLEEGHYLERAWFALFYPHKHTMLIEMSQSTFEIKDHGFSC